jgi:glycosyltransferase involved in cell wall biosynthesis
MSHESAPLISIIVAVFNGVKTLQQCIDSVAKQTYPNKELIIIDGGSNDGTVDLLWANEEQISYWVSEPDQGIYNAWNKGLAQAQGEWICFLGADDFFWELQVLERISTQLEKLPASIQVAYGQTMLISMDGESLYSVGEPWEKIKERFLQVMCINHQGVMHRRGLFEQHGKFDESFHIAGDYELLLRELKKSDASFIPGTIFVAMRQGGISSKPENTLLAMKELRRAQRMHGQLMPGWIWFMAMVRVYIRLLLWNSIGEQATRKLIDLGRRMTGRPSYWTKT